MKREGDDEVLSSARELLNIHANELVTKDEHIERVKIKDAKFYPKIPNYWKETKLNIYNLLSSNASDYIRSYNFNGIYVIASPAKYDGQEWLHISFSRKSRIPDYKDIQLVRKDFIGKDKKCFMVFPSEEHYVNIAENCLHLWYSEENTVPDFDVEIEGIGRSI